ncbi:sensor histidine kinase [Hymenobacter psychrophilus]|uniref:histidine kinase n=1 Tax=Hymenobacter psychrophilus TaxID=651662 RepID=A0A1H3D272_9BACT|nr:sensor histidine kinase [Hymenobacter psychrophilus]SDX59759.1 Na+/proline symporter [Hymenobacter psychrophilus]
MSPLLVIGFSFGYLGLLFGVAYAAERRAKARRSLVSNPYVYALSMAVYCTAWTYYGSVGRAAKFGLEFVGIYLGPTLMAPLAWLVLRKIIRICRTQRLTSIADFISARYGKSAGLGALATVGCVLGVVPYISLQIKAIADSFEMLTHGPGALGLPVGEAAAVTSAFYTTVALAFFTIVFGVRSIEATERHEGMVLAVAIESVFKLVAFLVAGLFVTYGLFNGFADVFEQAAAVPDLRRLFTLEGAGTAPGQWLTLLLLSMSAILLLPRQFQVSVVENVNENHLRKAMWLFPLYLIIINLLVLPLAFGGRLLDGTGQLDADMYVLALPLQAGRPWLALFIYLGGLSAASSMIVVETIALSVMISHHLLMPLLVREPVGRAEGPRWFARLGQLALHTRRLAVVLVLALAFGYYAAVGHVLPLVNIGLISFAAVAQFAPVVLGGLYWQGGTRAGATAGLLAGLLVWLYTLVLPTMVEAGLLAKTLLTEGPLGQGGLRPGALLGLHGLDPLSHGLFWSWFFNVGLYVGVSLLGRAPSALEQRQAQLFVHVFRHEPGFETGPTGWHSVASLPDVRALLTGFLGRKRTTQALDAFLEHFPGNPARSDYATGPAEAERGLNSLGVGSALSAAAVKPDPAASEAPADPRLLAYAEKLLAGAIGPASARLLLRSSVGVEDISFDNVVVILKESQQLLEANRQLQKQQRQLQALTSQLQQAYDQLQELDQHKDEFLYTVTHELRTPLTSIRALSEILSDNPDLEEQERHRFLHTITREAERLSRLIALVLDLEKYESGTARLVKVPLDVADIITDALEAVGPQLRAKQIRLDLAVPPALPALPGDRDRLMQVLVNLLSNAIKSCQPGGAGRIAVGVEPTAGGLLLWVQDNGKGIAPEFHHLLFDKFYQAQNQTTRKPEGTGLGLAITKKIVELHAGRIWVESEANQGARFSLEIPLQEN